MKQIITILFLMLVSYSSVHGQWKNFYPDSQTSAINQMVAVDNDVIWFMDQTKTALDVSKDGGVTWFSYAVPTTAEPTIFGGFHAVNDKVAYLIAATGEKGLWKTMDSGETWTRLVNVFDANSPFPNQVYFWNENDGVALGDAYPKQKFEIYTTSNGGLNWNKVSDSNITGGDYEWSFNTNDYIRVHGNSIVLGTGKGNLLRSDDKGMSWKSISIPLGGDLGHKMSFDFKGSNELFATLSLTTEEYKYFYSNDGGSNWAISDHEKLGDIYYDEIHDVLFTTHHWYGFKYSLDKGQSWITHQSFEDIGITGLAILPNGTVFLGGWGEIFSTNNYASTNAKIEAVTITNEKTIKVTFDTNVSNTKANTTQYLLIPNKELADTAKIIATEVDPTNPKSLLLSTDIPLVNYLGYRFRARWFYDTEEYPVLDDRLHQIMGTNCATEAVIVDYGERCYGTLLGDKRVYEDGIETLIVDNNCGGKDTVINIWTIMRDTAKIKGPDLTRPGYVKHFNISDSLLNVNWSVKGPDASFEFDYETNANQIIFLTPGKYTIYANGVNDCMLIKDSLIVDVVGEIDFDGEIAKHVVYDTIFVAVLEVKTIELGVQNTLDELKLSVYPNPAKDQLTIESENVIQEIMIYNAIGQLVHHANPNTKTIYITDNEIENPGIYIVNLKQGEQVLSLKIMFE